MNYKLDVNGSIQHYLQGKNQAVTQPENHEKPHTPQCPYSPHRQINTTRAEHQQLYTTPIRQSHSNTNHSIPHTDGHQFWQRKLVYIPTSLGQFHGH